MLPHSALVDYLVHQTVFPCFLRDHPVIPLGVGLDPLRRLAGILGKDLVDTLLDLQEVLHVDLHIVLEDGPDVIIWILQRKQTSKGLFDAILSLVREGIASGEFTTEKTAEDLTDFILDCYRGATYAWYRSDGTIDLRHAIAEHVGFALEHFLRK